jgi:hypothetical protein
MLLQFAGTTWHPEERPTFARPGKKERVSTNKSDCPATAVSYSTSQQAGGRTVSILSDEKTVCVRLASPLCIVRYASQARPFIPLEFQWREYSLWCWRC